MARKPSHIELTNAEQEVAQLVGTLRQTQSEVYHDRDRHGFEGDRDASLAIHIQGAAGELTVAKVLGVYWDFSVGRFRDGSDVADFQVRTRSELWHDLLIRPDDRDDSIYILVAGQMPRYAVLGWARGHEAKQPQWLHEYGGRPAAYFMPQEHLHRIEALARSSMALEVSSAAPSGPDADSHKEGFAA